MASAEDTSNFFKRSDYNKDYWDNYLAACPDYDQPFYQSNTTSTNRIMA